MISKILPLLLGALVAAVVHATDVDVGSLVDDPKFPRDMDEFNAIRTTILDQQFDWRFGNRLELTENDKKLNEIYMKAKSKLLERGFDNERRFAPSKYFIAGSPFDDPSDNLYKIIRELPKGSLLHTHQSATHDLATFPKMLFTLENCKICETEEGKYRFHFFDDGVWDMGPEYTCRVCPSEDDASYEDEVKLAQEQLSMFDGFPYHRSTIQKIWERFEGKFGPMGDAKDAYHVWKATIRSTLDVLVADNVQYSEWRTGFSDRLWKNGTVVPFEDALAWLEETIQEYRQRYPNFYGVRIICTKGRVGLTDEKLLSKLVRANELYQKSHLVKGFDIVGSEESGRTLLSVAPVFIQWRHDSGSDMPFIFHAGETLWSGLPADANVLDAEILMTKRIGHGYALDAHPLVLELVRAHNTSIELNVLSNQILALVDDIRNHRNKRLMDVTYMPASFSDNPLKFSVNSDDCLIFGTKPITDDMYAIILAMTHADSDLRQVKQFGLDSIETSLLLPEEKEELTEMFLQQWDLTVERLISTRPAKWGASEESQAEEANENDMRREMRVNELERRLQQTLETLRSEKRGGHPFYT